MTIPELPRMKTEFLDYGKPIKVEFQDGGKVLLDPNVGGNRPGQIFMGKLSKDGNWIHGLQQGAETVEDVSFNKILGDSCIVADSVGR
jgi:hypothetical protein